MPPFVQPNPKVKDDVIVKGSRKGQKWNASVVFIGKYMYMNALYNLYLQTVWLWYCIAHMVGVKRV